MVDQSYTALVLIVDRSGSMAPIATDMEGGIKTLIADQRGLPGKLTVDYVLFDDQVDYVASLADPATVDVALTPRGMTALNDAVGSTVEKFGRTLAETGEDERPGKVLVAIVTDGHENASKDYTGARVKELVEQQTEEWGWEFLYLGANQDAVKVAHGMGIAAGSALTYNTANAGAMAASVSSYVTTSRVAGRAAFTDADRSANR